MLFKYFAIFLGLYFQRDLRNFQSSIFDLFFCIINFIEIAHLITSVLEHMNHVILEFLSNGSHIGVIHEFSICFSFVFLVMWSYLLASQLTLNCHVLHMKNYRGYASFLKRAFHFLPKSN